MIPKLIEAALRNRIIVLLFATGVIVYGIYAVKTTPVDAIPYLSEMDGKNDGDEYGFYR